MSTGLFFTKKYPKKVFMQHMAHGKILVHGDCASWEKLSRVYLQDAIPVKQKFSMRNTAHYCMNGESA